LVFLKKPKLLGLLEFEAGDLLPEKRLAILRQAEDGLVILSGERGGGCHAPPMLS
jgi:hypothetical protein